MIRPDADPPKRTGGRTLRLASGPTLVLAVLLDGPALWHAFVAHDLDASTALLRYLIAVPVSAVLLAVLRLVTGPYRAVDQPLRVTARRLDDERANGTPPSGTAPPPGTARPSGSAPELGV
jgi:hypothetical protein